MEQSIKRSLTGYRPKDVNRHVNLKKEEFLQRYSNYESELKTLTQENDKLKEEVEALEIQMKEYKELRKKIEDILYKSYIDACTRTYETGRRLEEMMEYKMGIIRNQHHKNEEIKILINKLMKKVSSVIEESY